MIIKKDTLISELDDFFKTILEECTPNVGDPEDSQSAPAGPRVGLVDRLKVFEAGVRWVAVKNKLDSGEIDDEFAKLRRGYRNGGTGSRGAAASAKHANGTA